MDDNQKVVKAGEKLGYLSFSCANNIAYNLKSMYYYTFLTLILRVDVLVAGVILAVGTIWDAVNDPLIAIYAANRTFKNGEKLRPYALYMCIPWAISVVLLFTNFHLNSVWTAIVCILVYFVFEALDTVLCMPYNSLASLASRNDEDRKSINAFRSLGSVLGTGLGAVAILPIIQFFGGLKDHDILGEADSPAMVKTAVIMGVICILGSLIHYYTSKERIKSEEKEEHINLIQAYKMLFKCKSWVINMFYIMGYGIISTMVMQTINYYAAYVLGASSEALPIQAIYLVMAIATSALIPAVDRKLGRKKTMVIAVIIMVIGKIPFIINPYSRIFVYLNALTVGIGLTATFVLFNTNRNNIADVLEVQNGRRVDALVAGGDNLITKLIEAFAIEMMSVLYKISGFDEALLENQSQGTINTINAFLGWIPAVIALLMLIFVFRLDINKELAEAKNKNSDGR